MHVHKYVVFLHKIKELNKLFYQLFGSSVTFYNRWFQQLLCVGFEFLFSFHLYIRKCTSDTRSYIMWMSPFAHSQFPECTLYMEASPKFALYLYQILGGFMGSYRSIKQWKMYIMWQHLEDMPIWGVKVRKSDSHCSMLSVLLGDNKRIKVFDNLSKCSGMCQKCIKVL